MFKFLQNEISETEKVFILKVSQYLKENCEAIYGTEYIPRLVQRICRSQGINLEIHRGILYIHTDNKHYTIPYAYNYYKGYIVDLSLFVVKNFYKTRQFDDDNKNQFTEIPVFPNLSSCLVSNFNKQDESLRENCKIAYKSTKLILNKDFQPNEILDNDKLLLAIYSDCYAHKIANDILGSKLEEKDVEPSIKFITWPDLQSK
jgi:hypothetical protein